LAATAYRAAALKFAARTLGGGLLFFAAHDLVRDAAQARRVTLAVLAGAALSAAVAMLESAVPELAVWRHFRPADFSVLGLHRASGAFAYPTIAAMYWEAALPLAIAVPLALARPAPLGERTAARGRARAGRATAVGAAIALSGVLAAA